MTKVTILQLISKPNFDRKQPDGYNKLINTGLRLEHIYLTYFLIVSVQTLYAS